MNNPKPEMMISPRIAGQKSNIRDAAAGKQAIAALRTWIRAANADPPQNLAIANTGDPRTYFLCVAESRNRV